MAHNRRTYPVGKLSVLALFVIALYPMSHFPLLPVFNVSPFQLIAVMTAVYGIVVSLMALSRSSKITELYKRLLPMRWALIFIIWLSVSFAWGRHTSHELYYIGLVLISLFFTAGVYRLLRVSKLSLRLLSKIIIISAIVVSFAALWQFTAESTGLSRTYTGICPTCLQHDIGFARPSGFSQEPQHFSTILLGPLVLSLTLLLGSLSRRWQTLLWASVFVMITALLLSASRSGLIALVGVVGALSAYALVQKRRRFVLNISGVLVAAIIFTLAGVAWSGTVGDKAGSAYVAERYVAHATGGLVVVGGEQARLDKVDSSVAQKETAKQQAGIEDPNYITEGAGEGPSGAIAYSAQSRLETYKMALSIWTDNPRVFLFGVGWGGFGASAQQREPAAFTKDTIVNNQYLQLAAELGVIGLSLAVFAVWQLARLVLRSAQSNRIKLAIIVLFSAYGIQLFFYSGLHLLQFWLSAAIVAYILVGHEAKTRKKTIQKID